MECRDSVFICRILVLRIFTLVIPCSYVIGVQNIQAVGVLLARDYIPPINTIYTTPSIVTFFNAFMVRIQQLRRAEHGIVSSEAAGKRRSVYAAFFEGCWWVLIGLLGKVGVGLRKQVPAEFILTLADWRSSMSSSIHHAHSAISLRKGRCCLSDSCFNVSLFKIGAASGRLWQG